jgi:O-antigen ligase
MCGLAALTLAVGYAALNMGGIEWRHSNVSLLIIGVAALILPVTSPHPHRLARWEQIAIWASLVFPLYVASQLVPLPLPILRVVSPMRAETSEAFAKILQPVHYASLTLSLPETRAFLFKIAGYVLVFLVIRAVTRRSRESPWIISAPLLLIGGFEAVCAFVQHFGGANAVSGTYASRDHLAGLLEMVLPFALMYSMDILSRGRSNDFRTASVLKALPALLLAAAILLAVTFSLAKMGFFATLGSLFVMGCAAFSGRSSGRRRWGPIAALAGVLLLLAVFLPTPELKKHIAEAALDNTGEGRFPTWQDTAHLIAAYPLFGCGLGGFYQGFLRYQSAQLNLAWFQAHNDYLQLLAELGIIGFLIPAAFVIAVFAKALKAIASRSVAREKRFTALACVGGLSAIVIHSFTDFNMYIPANAMVFCWICGIAVSLDDSVRPESQPAEMDQKRTRLIRNSAFALACATVVYSVAWLLFFHVFDTDKQAERIFCRFGVCDPAGMMNIDSPAYENKIAAVSSSDLVERLRRDQGAPNRWEDLAEAFQREGRDTLARDSVSRALVLGPNLPLILFRAANFHFALDQNTIALTLMARVLKGDLSYWDRVFTAYQSRQIPIEQLLQFGLPGRIDCQAYLRFLLARKQIGAARELWRAILFHDYSDVQLANEYASFLLQNNNFEGAADAWTQYARKHEKGYRDCNRVFNGDFESKLSGSPFDWLIEQSPGATIDISHADAHSGSYSVGIQFDGHEKVSAIGLRQTVFLKSGRYRFRAFVRMNGAVTDRGVVFRLVSQRAPKPLAVTTEPILGSSDWTAVVESFSVPPLSAGLFELSLAPAPTLLFDRPIRGALWIDTVSISPEPDTGNQYGKSGNNSPAN